MYKSTDCSIYCATSITFTDYPYLLGLLNLFSLIFLAPQISLENFVRAIHLLIFFQPLPAFYTHCPYQIP
jgi:hypothetical protein